MLDVKAKDVLFKNQDDEYAQIIASYPICHEDCIEILKVAALLKDRGLDTITITAKMTELFR